MAISVRLDASTRRALVEAAAARGVTQSELIRRCLNEFLAQQEARPRAWQLGQDLFGQVGSGNSDLSTRRKQLIREKIHARKGRR